MIRNHWLLQLSQRRFPQRGRKQHRFMPCASAMTRHRVTLSLEALEDRLALSATITDIGVLPGDELSSANAISASGQVVGVSEKNLGVPHASFLYSNGQMTDLGTLPGFTTSSANGINSSGQVVGVAATTTSTAEASFLYSNGQMIDLGTLPGGNDSEAYGINDSGQVVGGSTGSDTHAFLYSNGQMTDLGTLPGGNDYSKAIGINSTGQVVGDSDTSSGVDHAFLYSNGQMTDLGTLPGGTFSLADGINDSGQVVGEAGNSKSFGHAFLYSNGQMTDLGTLPGGNESKANGINSTGQVVGWSDTSGSMSQHAFLYSNGKMIDLNTLLPANSGWVLTDATAINDSDQLVGTGTINGQQHAFLLNLSSVSLSPATLSTGIVNTNYTQTITASGGTGDKTLTYKITSGAIPGGLTVTPKTNELDISGTPTGAGTVTFTVTATDSASPPHSITQTYTLAINAAAVAPNITANPTNQTVTAAQTATFTASASGTPTPTVQWQVSTNGGKTFANITGATTATLSLSNLTTAMSGYEYQAVFTNSGGTATTRAAALTVQSAPVVTTNPSNQSSTVGQIATFTAAASGNPTPKVQWQVSTDGGKTFTNITGATFTTLTLSNATSAMNGDEYRAIFSSSAGTAFTNAATLTVNAPPLPPPPPPPPPPPKVPPLLAFLDSLLGGVETVNDNGTETITDRLFGIPLLVSTFESTGNLESVLLFGFNVTALFELL